jgi:hypothetical protein
MDKDAELGKYFDFDEADLNANRLGSLTPRQQARDKKDTRSTKRVLRIAGFGFLAFAIFPAIVLLLEKSAWRLWLIWSLWLVTWIFLAIILLRMSWVDTTVDTLKTVEGRVKPIQEEKEDGHGHKFSNYYWIIGGIKFDAADADKVELLEQGATYRVYYLDLSKQILSVERVSNGEKG